MRQEIYSKGKEMHNEMSGQWFLKRKMKMAERGQQKKEFQY